MKETPIPQIELVDEITVIQLGPGYENVSEQLLGTLQPIVLKAVEGANPPFVVMDLSQTKFFGSSFIELLFLIWKQLKARDGNLALAGVTEYCLEVIEITHLDQLWPVCPTRQEALTKVRSTPGEHT